MITARDKHKEALRELNLRHRVYPRWVEKGTLSQKQASRQLDVMEAIVRDYERLAEAEDAQGRLL